MSRSHSIAAFLVLVVLLTAPAVWGCAAADMQNCRMSECPMHAPQPADTCHGPSDAASDSSSTCQTAPQSWVACCDQPSQPEPAKVDSLSAAGQATNPLVVLTGQVRVRPPERPSRTLQDAVSAQRHELGHYTLLASFLL